MNMKKAYLLFVLLLILPINLAENQTSDIQQKFLEAEDMISELSLNGFNIQRVNDTYKAATQIYEVQKKIKNENNRDYDLILKYLGEITELNDQAYKAKDEIEYVYLLYDDIKEKNPQINLSEASSLLADMEFEFENEVYDEAYDLAKQSYSKLIEIEGKQTALNLAYQATTKTIKSFIVNNWIIILIVFVAGGISFFIFKNRFIYYRTKHKINKLEIESKVLESLIAKAQKEYFEGGTISEATYRIRTKKFSELTRDINRQLPLLREELVKRKKEELEDHKSGKKKIKKTKGLFKKLEETKKRNKSLKERLFRKKKKVVKKKPKKKLVKKKVVKKKKPTKKKKK
ncbi:hypothetical protein K8R33_04845 [archaeon]|nr:hypothetical protein [archaeon]